MDHTTMQDQAYQHQDSDGMDILTYYDEGCRKVVKLKFPRQSQPGISEQVTAILSEAFLSGSLSTDSEDR